MKIAMLTSSYPKWAGETTAPFIEEIAASMAAHGHEVHVVLPYRHDLRRQARERGVYLHPFHYAPGRSLEVWGYAAGLRGDVDLKPATLLAAPLGLTQGLRTLLQLTRHGDFDLIHGHWILPNGTVAALGAQARRLPLVVSLHGSDVFFAERNAATALVARWTARQAGMITACSNDLAARLVALGAEPRRLMTVPYGVDAEQFVPSDGQAVRADLGIAPDQPLLMWISRMVYKKGVHVLLDALPMIVQAHPRAVLLLGGYGDLRDELVAQAQWLGLSDHVRFPGSISHDEVNRYWNAADVAVVPAIHDQRGNVDGLPNMLLEAMSAGRPIVASRIAGIPQVINDGVHGLLVPEGDPAALAQAIIRLLDDRTLASRLGAAARARVERELRWSHIAARFEQVYELAQRRHLRVR
ncbi:MAG: glycosyltransferase [Herpetosiphonaceae bacterium]|nr:glycosyltransferase [Herpetosiphonaceae bacterium]